MLREVSQLASILHAQVGANDNLYTSQRTQTKTVLQPHVQHACKYRTEGNVFRWTINKDKDK